MASAAAYPYTPISSSSSAPTINPVTGVPTTLKTTPGVSYSTERQRDPSSGGLPQAEKDLQEILNSFISTPVSQQVQVIDTNASAGAVVPQSTLNVPVPATPAPTQTNYVHQQASAPVPVPAPQQNLHPSIPMNFNIRDILQTPQNTPIPEEIHLDVSDIEAMTGLTKEQKEKLVDERTRLVKMENWLRRNELRNNEEFAKKNQDYAGVWLEKVVAQQQANPESQSRLLEGLKTLLIGGLSSDKTDAGRKNIETVIEATASALNTLSHQNTVISSQLEQAYQESKAAKQRAEAAEQELNARRTESDKAYQYQRYQNSLVSPVATLQQQVREPIQPQQPVQQQQKPVQSVYEQVNNLPGFAKVFIKGALVQNKDSAPDIQRDMRFAHMHQENFSKLKKLGEDPTFGQLYDERVFGKRQKMQ